MPTLVDTIAANQLWQKARDTSLDWLQNAIGGVYQTPQTAREDLSNLIAAMGFEPNINKAYENGMIGMGPMPLVPIKRPLKVFHGTDSPMFNQYSPELADKGYQYFNPLGSGLYFTTEPRFAANFGSNVYESTLPIGTDIHKISNSKWFDREYPTIFNKTIRELDFPKNDISPYELSRARNGFSGESPIDSLNSLHSWLSSWKYNDPDEIATVIEKIVNERYKKYDAVRYMESNYPWSADEIVLKPDRFMGFERELMNPLRGN